MIHKLPVCLTSAAALLASAVAPADVPFTPIADFGLGGSVYDINSAGAVVGVLRTSAGISVPTVWESASAAPVALPTEGRGGFASAINGRGEVVGQTFQSFGAGGVPTVWRDGVRVELPDLGGGGDARDINEAGVIVGYVYSGGGLRPARWIDDVLEVLPMPPFGEPGDSVWGIAESINSAGVITGNVRVAWDSTGQAGSDSVALRWDDGVVSVAVNQGLETKGVSVDNLGNVLLNGYFGATSAPAVSRANGTLAVLPGIPGVWTIRATAMSRTGVVCGYYLGSDPVSGLPRWKGVAWANGPEATVATKLELPAGMAWAFPWGVGSNGIVIGEVSDGQSGLSIPGYWAVPVAPTTVTSAPASGSAGNSIVLEAVSARSSAPNVGSSVTVSIEGVWAGQGLTDASGRARISCMVPASAQGTQLSVRYTDESGASTTSVINVAPGCASADLNCDGRVDGVDLGVLFAQWGGAGSGDLDRDGVVNGVDLGRLLVAWNP
jgi:hypothetical protein